MPESTCFTGLKHWRTRVGLVVQGNAVLLEKQAAGFPLMDPKGLADKDLVPLAGNGCRCTGRRITSFM